MLQFAIGTIAIVALSVYIRVDEAEQDEMQKKYDETDWNEYYAQH